MQSDRPQPSVTTPKSVTPDHLSPLGFTYWQDGDFWLGYLDEFPDYVTQGEDDPQAAHRAAVTSCGAAPAGIRLATSSTEGTCAASL